MEQNQTGTPAQQTNSAIHKAVAALEESPPPETATATGAQTVYKAASRSVNADAKTPMNTSANGKKPQKRESTKRILLRAAISIVVIALGVFLILLLVSKAAMYDSIGSMLRHMFGELALMWERITA